MISPNVWGAAVSAMPRAVAISVTITVIVAVSVPITVVRVNSEPRTIVVVGTTTGVDHLVIVVLASIKVPYTTTF